ncbi:MAG: response regulator transcription factor [Chloroflexi bacterium]|nr:response regulator transcription factor [Chloroflexota bacterium]
MDEISVVIVDDHALVRQGLRTFLDLHDDIKVTGEAANGVEAVERVGQLRPDVVLMDLVMPEMDGIEAIKRIRSICPDTKVIVLTSFTEDEKLFPSIKAGATGYLLKNVSPEDLVSAIKAAHRGEAQLNPEIARRLMDEVSNKPSTLDEEVLTRREMDVLRLIAQGRNNRGISEELVLSEKTVKTHVSNILGKLHLADRTQAAIYAINQGLVSQE